ncbi:MAG TPA: hypothetical protein VKD22_01930 [Ramlibacter sp.]|nr:hypothetical protein [Ramlibacter sp.]
MKNTALAVAIALLAGTAAAKLPPPDEATKAKAAEAKAKAAWQAKVNAYELCKAQDRVAALYHNKGVKQPAAAGQKSAAPPAAASTAAANAKGTPVASTPPPPCVDPGPFASEAPEQQPLESSGAHSPSGTAAGPPSVKAHSGVMQAPKKP